MRNLLVLFLCALLSLDLFGGQNFDQFNSPTSLFDLPASEYFINSGLENGSACNEKGPHRSNRSVSSGRHNTGKSKSSSPKKTSARNRSHANHSAGVARNSHGRIKRSSSEKHAFMKQSGYPKGRPGYVVDHIIPLKKGGCDCPSNMQWQTIKDAKAKDKWE